MIRRISYLVAFCLVSIITASSVTATERDGASGYGSIEPEIGFATVAVNVVKGTINTDIRNIKVSDHIFQQEIIETNSVSTTQIVFLDETVLTIGPESRLILDEVVFDRNATKGKVVITALKGLFAFISGSLPSDSYRILTPTSTIGVRGTKFDLFIARNGASTVILRSGAIDVTNLKGVVRGITTVGLATNVITKRTEPTPPEPPTSELEQLFTSLANPGELQGKNPLQVNTKRESVEKESIRKKKIELKREEAKDLKQQKIEQRKQQRKKKLDEKQQKKEERAKQREAKKAEKKSSKEAKKAEKIASKEAKKAAKKSSKETKQAAKKASKGAKAAANKASKSAKVAAKKASKSAKAAAKKASKSAKKAAKSAKKASKEAKKASKKAKKASRKAKRAAKKAAKSEK